MTLSQTLNWRPQNFVYFILTGFGQTFFYSFLCHLINSVKRLNNRCLCFQKKHKKVYIAVQIGVNFSNRACSFHFRHGVILSSDVAAIGSGLTKRVYSQIFSSKKHSTLKFSKIYLIELEIRNAIFFRKKSVLAK